MKRNDAIKVLAILSRLPSAFDSGRDVRLFNTLEYFAKTSSTHLLYFQELEHDNPIRNRLIEAGVDVFSIKEKRKAGIYDMEIQMKEVLQEGGYKAVYFGGHYIAKYYLPYITEYIPEALIIIDTAGSQYVAAHEYSDMVRDSVRKIVACKEADRYMSMELPILSRADIIFTDRDSSAAKLHGIVSGAKIEIFNPRDATEDFGTMLTDIQKKTIMADPAVDAVLISVESNADIGSFHDENAVLLTEQENVRIVNIKATSFKAGINAAINKLKAQYVFFATNDILINKRTLKDLLWAFKFNNKSGIACPASNLSAGVKVDKAHQNDFIIKHYRSNYGNWHNKKTIEMECFMARSDLFKKLGKMSDDISSSKYALMDYSFRLRQAGYEIIQVNEAFVISRFGDKSTDTYRDDSKKLYAKWADRGAAFLDQLMDKIE